MLRKAITNADRWAVIESSDRCGICRGPITGRDEVHVDHIIPVADGGASTRDNLQIAHEWCNRRKGAGRPVGVAARGRKH